MDPRLLQYYEGELRHLRETAAEFAREYPKIADRLRLDKDGKQECPDPYVERLLEGFAFLAARVHLKLDAEFPRFTQSLLETVYSHYLSPTPSMAVVRFDIDEKEGGLAAGPVVPRGTLLRSIPAKGDRTACTFRTAHDVRLLPLCLAEARYYTRDVKELGLPPDSETPGHGRMPLNAKAAIRLRLQATAGLTFKDVQFDSIGFFLRGAAEDNRPSLLYEQVFARKLALVVQSGRGQDRTTRAALPPSCIRRIGFSDREALLPARARAFEGYRLLREYFAFPQRFLFFELTGFGDSLRGCQEDALDLVIALEDQEIRLEGKVDASCFEMFCTPVINLFPKQLDRIQLTDRFAEFHAVPDRTRPLDFEVFEVEDVTAYEALSGEEQKFSLFYKAKDTDFGSGAFYTINRVKRTMTQKERQLTSHVRYAGSEVYLSLVDAKAAPFRSTFRELGVRALCTNRHLPLQMAVGVERTDFSNDLSIPVAAIRCITRPTEPQPSFAEGELSWRIISHLSLNYLSLLDEGEEGAVALRDLLRLYVSGTDEPMRRQIDGLRSVRSVPIIRRVATSGPVAFARGLQITVEFDERMYEGTGVLPLGAVLERFFAKYVSLNSFTETVIQTQQRGTIIQWPSQVGTRQII